MTKLVLEQSDPRAALEAIPRERLPEWLSQAIDLISLHLDLFPPLEAEMLEVMEHLYPH